MEIEFYYEEMFTIIYMSLFKSQLCIPVRPQFLERVESINDLGVTVSCNLS